MKEFFLTQEYSNLTEMINSDEVAIYKKELQTSDIEKYAIVSRIGNRYDLDGNYISDFVVNPYLQVEEEKITEVDKMKYAEIEAVIDNIINTAVEKVKAEYEERIATLETAHEVELAQAKAEAKSEAIAELIEKLKA